MRRRATAGEPFVLCEIGKFDTRQRLTKLALGPAINGPPKLHVRPLARVYTRCQPTDRAMPAGASKD